MHDASSVDKSLLSLAADPTTLRVKLSARSVVEKVAPAEASFFEELASMVPEKHHASRNRRQPPLAFGIEIGTILTPAIISLTSLAISFIVEYAVSIAKDIGKDVIKSKVDKWLRDPEVIDKPIELPITVSCQLLNSLRLSAADLGLDEETSQAVVSALATNLRFKI